MPCSSWRGATAAAALAALGLLAPHAAVCSALPPAFEPPAVPAPEWPEGAPKPAHIVAHEQGLTTDAVVNTTLGPVKGYSYDGVTYFHSIPFAAPPTGDRRFKAPEPATPWTDVLDVTGQPNICSQIKIIGDILMGHEDCMYLHVYIPDHDPAEQLPVLFWIYGGGYIFGDAYEFGFYDATTLAKERNVIVVAPNYRLGAFAFLALDELKSEDKDGSTGNMALLDQTMALQFANDNVAAFGGDPKRIAIFGESAGGFSVCWHLVSPRSKGLFSAAIMESGSCDAQQFFTPLSNALEFGYEYAASLGCTQQGDELLSCLRALKTEDVMKSILSMANPDWPFNSTVDADMATAAAAALHTPVHEVAAQHGMAAETVPPVLPPFAPFMPWGPAIDDIVLPDLPIRRLAAGDFNKVPTIMGTNLNEGMIFVPAFPIVVKGTKFPPSDDDMRAIIRHEFTMRKMNASIMDEVVEDVMNRYPVGDFGNDYWKRAAKILTQYFFTCGTRRSARAMSNFHDDIWLYHFVYPLTFIEYGLLGDYHASELCFVFDNQWPPILHTFSGHDQDVAAAFGHYWSNMAILGEPNDPTVTHVWPRYNRTGDESLVMNWPVETETGLDSSDCDAWDKIEELLNGGPF